MEYKFSLYDYNIEKPTIKNYGGFFEFIKMKKHRKAVTLPNGMVVQLQMEGNTESFPLKNIFSFDFVFV